MFTVKSIGPVDHRGYVSPVEAILTTEALFTTRNHRQRSTTEALSTTINTEALSITKALSTTVAL